MPMRIVNLKAASGGGGGTVVNSDTSGLFKFVHHDTNGDLVNDRQDRIYSPTDFNNPRSQKKF